MSALPEMQRRFLRAMLRQESPKRDARDQPEWPAERLAIYRNNVRLNFHAALRTAFPLLHHLMGADEFERMAWACQRAFPSPSGNLLHAGEALPGFLDSCLAGTAGAHLGDVARLERAIGQVLAAADDVPPFEVAALARVPADRHGDVRFGLQPAVRLLETAWPVYERWRDFQAANGVPESLHPPDAPAPGREYLLATRAARRVGLQRLGAGDYRLLCAFAAGADLRTAVDAALDADAEFDLQRSLAHWLQTGLVVGGAASSAADGSAVASAG